MGSPQTQHHRHIEDPVGPIEEPAIQIQKPQKGEHPQIPLAEVGSEGDVDGRFTQGEALSPSFDHHCSMLFLELFDGEELRRDLGKDVIERLTEQEQQESV